ncbi:hypothetical protein [Neobacillus soli]|uniref:hypothetical protein n=1 Tax=Neobacillus soli TaxID=220688 RepID=UPI0008269D07|nr:hypothetical protein [Neobacillus soli]
MKIENPHFIIEPVEGTPFAVTGSSTADSIVSVTIDGNVCEIYLSVKDDWKIIGVLSPLGTEYDKEDLRLKLLSHPKLRLHYLTGGN